MGDGIPLEEQVEALVESGFAGVVRLDVAGDTVLRRGFGLAERAHGRPMTADTRLAVASGSKTFTALAVLSLVEDGVLALDAPAREWLGDDLPLVPDAVTLEHLLSHRSGIGDYLDEDVEVDRDAYIMPVSVHLLADTESYVPLLEGHPAKFAPGTGFSYCNQGFVVLALIAERASGTPFHDLVRERVIERAGMRSTAYLRSDALPADAALGYVEMDGEVRSNVFHLPVRGGGDGGAFTTVDDVHRFWPALLEGRIIGPAAVAEMVRPHSEPDEDGRSYGLGLWLSPAEGLVQLIGQDAGVSFTSVHDARREATWTVIANRAGAAWPVQRVVMGHLDELVGPPRLA
jgi:CubicO group peptidase (beta-lactamase class C family)